jgi:hypothetical protein
MDERRRNLIKYMAASAALAGLAGCENLPKVPGLPGSETPTPVAKPTERTLTEEEQEIVSIKARLLEVGFLTDPQLMQVVNGLRSGDIHAQASGLYSVSLRSPRSVQFDLALGKWEGTNASKIIFRGYTDENLKWGNKDTQVHFSDKDQQDLQKQYNDPQSGIWPRRVLSDGYKQMFGFDPKVIYEDNGKDKSLRSLPRFPDEEWDPHEYPGSLIADGLKQSSETSSSVRYLRHWNGEVIAVITDLIQNPQAAAAMRKLRASV